MNIKKLLITALPGLVDTFIAMYVGSLLNITIFGRFVIALMLYLCTIILILIIQFFLDGWVKAKFNLWYIGKIKGLWKNRGLINQIKRNFYSANKIRIKVTRGSTLLKYDSREYGLRDILDNIKRGENKREEKVEIEILLIIPCFQQKHVRQRYERHTNMSEKDFLESWYSFLNDIRSYNSDNLSISVRFYFDSHSRWRFYICYLPNKTNVLLSTYDSLTDGRATPMYKIIKEEKNIGGFMTKYFDDLWENSLTPSKLYHYINTGRCQSSFCSKCNINGSKKCKNCEKNNCGFESTCTTLVEKYSDVLMSFSAGTE